MRCWSTTFRSNLVGLWETCKMVWMCNLTAVLSELTQCFTARISSMVLSQAGTWRVSAAVKTLFRLGWWQRSKIVFRLSIVIIRSTYHFYQACLRDALCTSHALLRAEVATGLCYCWVEKPHRMNGLILVNHLICGQLSNQIKNKRMPVANMLMLSLTGKFVHQWNQLELISLFRSLLIQSMFMEVFNVTHQIRVSLGDHSCQRMWLSDFCHKKTSGWKWK